MARSDGMRSAHGGADHRDDAARLLLNENMMRRTTMDDREELIRHRAYALWQAAGEPEGRHEEFWWQAESEIERQEAAPSGELDHDLAVSRKEAATRGHDGEAAAVKRVASDREAVHAGDKPSKSR